MGDLIQFRPWKEKRDTERLQKEAVGIVDYLNHLTGMGIPYGGAGIDGMPYSMVFTGDVYRAPESDPA